MPQQLETAQKIRENRSEHAKEQPTVPQNTKGQSLLAGSEQQLLNQLTSQYEELISWADLYDHATFEAKKMIVNCLIRRVEVLRDYKLNVEFNFDLNQFLYGLDLSA